TPGAKTIATWDRRGVYDLTLYVVWSGTYRAEYPELGVVVDEHDLGQVTVATTRPYRVAEVRSLLRLPAPIRSRPAGGGAVAGRGRAWTPRPATVCSRRGSQEPPECGSECAQRDPDGGQQAGGRPGERQCGACCVAERFETQHARARARRAGRRAAGAA